MQSATSMKLARYGLASLLSMCALPLARWMGAPSACFVLVVMACSLYLGRGPAFLATSLNCLAFYYYFLLPDHSAMRYGNPLVRLALSMGAMLLTIEMIERRRRSDRLRVKIAQSFESITQTSPDCILSINHEGCVEFANPAAIQLFGYSKEEVIGLPLIALLQSSSSGALPSGEMTALRKDKEALLIEATHGFFGDKTTVFLRDITARKRTEDALRWTQTKLAKASQIAAISELSASIAHEISQPISAMVANGQASIRWLKAHPVNVTDAQASIERIVRDGKDAKEIIDRLRSLYKHSAIKASCVSLADVCTEVVALLARRADLENIVVEIDIPADLPFLEGDKMQLQQVLLNLITNSMDAMLMIEKRERKISVRASKEEDSLKIQVQDSGSGLLDYEASFESFVTTKDKGLGMGLSICKSIVEGHGGRIWGATAPQHGSIFTFTIPCSSRRQL